MCIGRTVVMHPGVYLGHGQVVVDGFVEIHSGAARFVVAVQAQSIQRALSIVAARHPGSVASVIKVIR